MSQTNNINLETIYNQQLIAKYQSSIQKAYLYLRQDKHIEAKIILSTIISYKIILPILPSFLKVVITNFAIYHTVFMWWYCQSKKQNLKQVVNQQIFKIQQIMMIILMISQNDDNFYSKILDQQKYMMIKIQNTSKYILKQQMYRKYFINIFHKSLIYIYPLIGKALSTFSIQYALKCYRLYYRIHHNDDSKYLLGSTLIILKNIQLGTIYLEQIDYKKYNLQGLFLLAKTYYNERSIRQSLECYIKLLNMNRQQNYYKIRCHYEIAQILQEILFSSLALKHYLKSIQLNQQQNQSSIRLYFQSILRIAKIYSYWNQHLTSINLVEKIIDQENIHEIQLYNSYYLLGKCYKIIQNYYKSLYYFKKAHALEPNLQNKKQISLLNIIIQKYDEAQSWLYLTLQLDKTNDQILIYLAYIHAINNNLDKSIEILSSINSDAKISFTAYSYYIKIKQIISKYDQYTSFAINHHLSHHQIVSNLISIAQTLRSNFKLNLSLIYLSQALQLHPENSQILYEIGTTFLYAQQYDISIHYLQKALNLEQKDEKILLSLFQAYNCLCSQKRKYYLQKLKLINYEQALNLLPTMIDKSKYIYWNNIILNNLPNKINYQINNLFRQAFIMFNYHQYPKSLELFNRLYTYIYNNPKILKQIIIKLLQNYIFPIAHTFCKAYFTICPFDQTLYLQYLIKFSQIYKPQDTGLDVVQSTLPQDCTGQVYHHLARLFLIKKQNRKALYYAKLSIKKQMQQQYFQLLYYCYKKFKNSQKRIYLKISQVRPDYWNTNIKLSNIYRLKKDRQKQRYYLQAAIQSCWNRCNLLKQLCKILKQIQDPKFIYYANLLQIIDPKCISIQIKLFDWYQRQNNRMKCIQIINKILKINPTQKLSYIKLKQLYQKRQIHSNNNNNNNQQLCYILIRQYLNIDITSNSLIMSFWYKYYNRLQQSMSCFMLYLQQQKYKQGISSSTLSQIKNWMEYSMQIKIDKDLQLKLLIISQILQNQYNISYYFNLLIFDTNRSSTNISKQQQLNYYYHTYIYQYTHLQQIFIKSILMQVIQNYQTLSCQNQQEDQEIFQDLQL